MKARQRTTVEVPTVRSRELGRRLRHVKDETNLTGKALAQMMGMPESRLSKILGGLVLPTQPVVAGLLAHCGVTDTRRDQILDMCDLRHDQSVLRLVGSEQWDAYAAYAIGATRLTEYQPVSIPALAQTPEYTDTYLASLWDWPDERVEVGLTLRRVAEIDRLMSAEIIIHEWCLRTAVGSALMMSEQMHHLLNLSISGSVNIRVVGRDYRPKHVLPGGFALMEFSDQPAVVYRDDLTSGLFVDNSREVGTHRAVIERLKFLALQAAESRQLIRSIAAEYSRAADFENLDNDVNPSRCIS
jgi:transcriptional regulator with XRE-family HTH domain